VGAARDCDVLVVGAGIHGAAIARALARRGASVIVAERSAPAAGTSSRSSKLVHGGLRYLEHGDLGLVRESLRARAALLREAPELVERAEFLIPVYRGGTRAPWLVRAGLSLYAVLAGFGPDARFRALPRDEWPLADGLAAEGLRAVFRYTDAKTDDAGLTRRVLGEALAAGAVLRCPAEAAAIALDDEGATVTLSDGVVRAGAVVNAAGPWVARVQRRVSPALPPLAIALIRGSHLELPYRPLAGIYYLESPRDGRPLFVIPRGDHLLVGTTEVAVGDADLDRIEPSAAEVEYLLEAVRQRFPGWAADGGLTVKAKWAGVRVLPLPDETRDGSLNAASRELELVTDRERSPRFVSLVGGKLTTHAAAAERVVERLDL
jgi:glycerol-3-phosphate dehydrogenase